jgi:hypothetical protein
MDDQTEQERRARVQRKRLEKAARKAAAGGREETSHSAPPPGGGAPPPPAREGAAPARAGEGAPPQNNGLLPLERIYELVGTQTVLLPKKAGEKFPAGNGNQKITLEVSRAPSYQAKLHRAALKEGICLRLGILSDGLLAVDLDIDDGEQAAKVLEWFCRHQGWARHALTACGKPPHCQIYFRSSGYPRDRDQLLICLGDEAQTVVGELRNGEGNQWQSVLTGIHPKTGQYYTLPVKEPAPDIGPWPGPEFLPPELKLIRAKEREANQTRRAAKKASAKKGGGAGTGKKTGGASPEAPGFLDLDLIGLLEALGIAVKLLEEKAGACGEEDKYAVRCPWVGEHTTDGGLAETVIWQLPGGGRNPTFHCSHKHCSARGLEEVLKWAEGRKAGITAKFCRQPELVLPSGTVPYPGSARALWTGVAPLLRYFVRSTLIEEIVRNKEGRNILQPLSANALRHRIDLHFRTVAWRVNKSGDSIKKPTRCTHDVAIVLLGATEAVELLPGIKKLSRCSVLNKKQKDK